MAYQVIDFKDIQDAIIEELKVQASDTVTLNRVQRVVNQVYLQEVVPFARWKWLEGSYRVVHKSRYNASTVTVVPNTSTVVMAVTPALSYGSFAGKKFAVDGYNEIYYVESHTAGSNTLTLSTEYTGNYSITAGFKIWTDEVALPLDARETVSVWHNFHSKPMEGTGLQKLRSLMALNPRAEGYPSLYYTGDFSSPTEDEYEATRFRKMLIHPSINKTDVTLHIDYVKEVTALELDGDEPIMPVEDRIVLVYGALARLWKSVNSDIEQAQLAKADFMSKLARMAGKVEDSQDPPKLKPDSSYVRTRRAPRFSPQGHNVTGAGGGSGYEQISYLEDVTIKGANVTGAITVVDGVTIDGVDISALQEQLDVHESSTDIVHTASAIGFAPAGNIEAEDVQLALVELDNEKIAKPLSATDNAIVRFDGTEGEVQESLVVIEDDGGINVNTEVLHTPLQTAFINNDVLSPAVIFTFPVSDFSGCIVEYSITRGAGNVEIGHIYMATDGASVAYTPVGTSIGAVGITFSADISGSDIRLLYTSTNSGETGGIRYIVRKWI